MKFAGIFIIVTAIAIPLIWFLPLAAVEKNPAFIYGQYAGAVSLILMGITLLLATRFYGIEKIFGPMDRVYVLHKWLGVIAAITGFYHFQTFVETPELDTPVTLWPALSDIAIEVGIVAFFSIVVLVVASLLTIIPYHIWKWSHRLIGFSFAAITFHYLFVTKSFPVFDSLGLYLMTFCVMGVGSYLYLLISRLFGLNTVKYQVAEVIKHQNVAEIRLQPDGAGIRHKPGQFAFINFQPFPLSEVHPFTIASAPNNQRELTFIIKGLGEYTNRLRALLKPGTIGRVSQPFGHFSLSKTTTPQVWIGAGIGITPFIAWSQALEADWPSPTRLYYCVSSPEEALYLAEFEAVTSTVPNFELVLVVSGKDKRLSADRIAAELKGTLRSADVYFCGPTIMRETLKAGLISHGLPWSKFHNEEFEMRSGLGFLKLYRWFMRLSTSKS